MTSFRTILEQSFKATNPGINLTKNFPVYDTMIAGNETAIAQLDDLISTLESNVDYSTFFDTNGKLISSDKMVILKNNFFLGDGIAQRGYGNVLLEFDNLQTSITVNTGLKLLKDGQVYLLEPGTYQVPVHSIFQKKIRYALKFSSEITGAAAVAVSSGIWTVSAGRLPVGCLGAVSVEATTPGIDNVGNLTKDNINLLIAGKTLDKKSSILGTVNSMLYTTGIAPDLLTLVGFEDPEYQSGVIPFEDEDNAVKMYRVGGYVDMRLHEGFTLKELYFDGAPEYINGMYKYKIELPVYAVEGVYSWAAPIYAPDKRAYRMDYVNNYLMTPYQKIKVVVLTTDTDVWNYTQAKVRNLYVSAGSIRMLPFNTIRVYLPDYNEAGTLSEESITVVNNFLFEYFKDNYSKSNFDFGTLKGLIEEATGVEVVSLYYRLPDNGEVYPWTSGDLIQPEGFTYHYGPQDLSIKIPMNTKNSIIVGGYSGVYGGDNTETGVV